MRTWERVTTAIAASLCVLAAGILTHQPIHDTTAMISGGTNLQTAAPRGAYTLPTVQHGAVSPAALASTCETPAPTSAAGYAAMFASVSSAQWGAGDVAISVPLPSRRVVWLYGDTISQVASFAPFRGRFVHSSAIVQHGGCLHVSWQGRAVLPDEIDLAPDLTPIPVWYWIKAAAAAGPTSRYGVDRLIVTADRVQATGTGVWQFKVIGQRTAELWVLAAGDVVFERWLDEHPPVPVQNIVRKDGGIYSPWSSTVSEVATGRVLVTGLPHTDGAFSYSPSVHPEARLASGRTLLTVCANRNPLRSYADYRPLFAEVTLS
jgi:hypothetical protein